MVIFSFLVALILIFGQDSQQTLRDIKVALTAFL